MACFWTNLIAVKQDCAVVPDPEPGEAYDVFLAGYDPVGGADGYLVSTAWPLYTPGEESPRPAQLNTSYEGGSSFSIGLHGDINNGAVNVIGGAIYLIPEEVTSVTYEVYDPGTDGTDIVEISVNVIDRVNSALILMQSEENAPGEKEWFIWDRYPPNLGLDFTADIGPFTIGEMPFVWSGPGNGYKLDQATMLDMEMELPEMSMCGEYEFYHEASVTSAMVVLVCWFTPLEEG